MMVPGYVIIRTLNIITFLKRFYSSLLIDPVIKWKVEKLARCLMYIQKYLCLDLLDGLDESVDLVLECR